MGPNLLRFPREICGTQSTSGANFLQIRNKTSPKAPLMRTGTNSVPPRNNGGTEAALLVGSKPAESMPPLTRAGQSWSHPHPPPYACGAYPSPFLLLPLYIKFFLLSFPPPPSPLCPCTSTPLPSSS